ncbi:DUF2339 domain-containing protein [Pseudothauera nasutitermitis]|uniref:DUF2339 domain-containing protein n=1 Tax=Pseudothauera nasutitermitis TaxID=2565930 RepID=A0A4S4B6I0_9RHOO|nr:DUF2339 domain-containing protein [Pseudothauera nasutitermitis]THF66567.1 DUF2339 domain-containing protein [Pseudothauera nasutitermitis]
MAGLVLGILAGLFLIGFLGGLVGARIGRRGTDRELLERLEARLERLERNQTEYSAPPVPLPDVSRTPPAAPASSPTPETLEFDLDLPRQARDTGAAPEPDTAGAGTPSDYPPPTPLPAPALPAWLRDWLFGGNTVVRVGIVILFFGVAFLLRYAYEHVQVPVELRLTGVALGAVVLLVLGWRLREKRAGYALALQGGAVGLLYLTVFAAFRLYGLIPPAAAFALLVVVAASSGLLALAQNGRSLAVLGTCGGFLAPILASTGSGNHVALFSYYALLNAGVLALAWRRTWRELNVLGFLFTFVIGGLWGARYYRPELFASVEPFLLLFFLMYLAVPIGYALRRRAEQADGKAGAYVDATLVFGTPLVAFGLQLRLAGGFEYGAAFSAVALGALYLGLAHLLWRRAGQSLRLLVEAYYALGVVFATLAIPLAFDGRWTAAAWALEAAAVLWIGVRQRRVLARAFAILLQLGAGAAFLLDLPAAGALPLLDAQFLGCALIALAGLFSAAWLDHHAALLDEQESAAARVLLVWGLGWWVAGGWLQAGHHLHGLAANNAFLLYLAASAAALAGVARRAAWPQGGGASLWIGPATALGALGLLAFSIDNPLAAFGWLAWPAALGAHLFALRLHEAAYPRIAPWLHALGAWVLALVGGLAAARGIGPLVGGASAWALLGAALVPGALIAVLASLRTARWPFGPWRHAYLVRGGAPLAVFLLAWSQFANWTHAGHADPLPYLPLLNPLELGLIAAVLLPAWWLAGARRAGLGANASWPAAVPALFALLTFALANGVLLRALHHFAGVPWDLGAQLDSRLVQAALSLFWTLIALGVMLLATRRAWRTPWLAGAALMGVVVVKLFLVDLSNIGGVERIVSFIGVGVLMLVIGWFAPVPPRIPEKA